MIVLINLEKKIPDVSNLATKSSIALLLSTEEKEK